MPVNINRMNSFHIFYTQRVFPVVCFFFMQIRRSWSVESFPVMYMCKSLLSNSNPFLDVQLTGAGKCFSTMHTCIALPFSMISFMNLTWIEIGEKFYTMLTWIRLLYSVTSFMYVMTTEVTEGFSKMFTCSRHFSRVNPSMTAQVTGTRKHLFTLLKYVWLQCELFSWVLQEVKLVKVFSQCLHE